MAQARVLTVHATGYTCDPNMSDELVSMNCPSMRKHPGGRTATGTKPVAGRTIACDRQYLNKLFIIEGFGVRRCEDRGGAIKGNRVDVFMASLGEAFTVNRTVQAKVVDL